MINKLFKLLLVTLLLGACNDGTTGGDDTSVFKLLDDPSFSLINFEKSLKYNAASASKINDEGQTVADKVWELPDNDKKDRMIDLLIKFKYPLSSKVSHDIEKAIDQESAYKGKMLSIYFGGEAKVLAAEGGDLKTLRKMAFLGSSLTDLTIPVKNRRNGTSKKSNLLLYTNDIKISKWLLDIPRCDPNFRNGNTRSPLAIAALQEDYDLCELYFKYKGDPNIEIGNPPPHSIRDLLLERVYGEVIDLETVYKIDLLFAKKGGKLKVHSDKEGAIKLLIDIQRAKG